MSGSGRRDGVKVLLCSFDSPATQQGGVEWYVHRLAIELEKVGHVVRVISRSPKHVPAWLEGVDYEWVDLPLTEGGTTHRYRLRHERAFARAVRRLAPWADVVHSQSADAFGALGVKPVVATVHTTPLDEWESSRLGGWREWTYQRAVEAYRRMVWRSFVERVEHVWTQGEHVRESLFKLGAHQVDLMPNPVPEMRRVTQAAARRELGLLEQPTAVYLGRLVSVKRPHRVVEAVAKMPGVQLVVAGEGPEAGRLAKLAEPLGERVTFLGRVDEWRKELLLNAADVVALPSEHEGQPIVLLEAMGLGVPIVTTDPAWVPQECRAFGFFGDDVQTLMKQAIARGRGERAPVFSYRDVALRTSAVYEAVARK